MQPVRPTSGEIHALCARCLNLSLALDPNLTALSRDTESHGFLINPSGQLSYLYLTELVRQVASRWTGRPFGDLKVLDWGSGKGHVTYLLKKLGGDVTSCDVQGVQEDDDSSFSQKTPIIDRTGIRVVPLTHEYELPFADRSFDVVVGFGVLEHVPKDRLSLRELNRVLKPSGLYFCFFLPYTFSWTQRLQHLRGDYYHDRLYSRRQVRGMLSESGFDALDMWHRALLPKNTIRYPAFHLMERLDHLACRWTPLKYLATNLEFVAAKTGDPRE